ncbi:hypothetical protein PINS_up001085 [Pythium insidiosum]|nr:hypothetical protein PINS_up001085 [Pythium insidiosum]
MQQQQTTEMSDRAVATDALRAKYDRANALVASVLNKYYNGSARAVDPFVIRRLQEEETRLFSLQCYVEQV